MKFLKMNESHKKYSLLNYSSLKLYTMSRGQSGEDAGLCTLTSNGG